MTATRTADKYYDKDNNEIKDLDFPIWILGVKKHIYIVVKKDGQPVQVFKNKLGKPETLLQENFDTNQLSDFVSSYTGNVLLPLNDKDKIYSLYSYYFIVHENRTLTQIMTASAYKSRLENSKKRKRETDDVGND